MGGQLVIPFLFNPLGVDVKLLAIADKRRVLHNVAVERNDRCQALNLVLGQSTSGAA